MRAYRGRLLSQASDPLKVSCALHWLATRTASVETYFVVVMLDGAGAIRFVVLIPLSQLLFQPLDGGAVLGFLSRDGLKGGFKRQHGVNVFAPVTH
jgi:hypothetical protein